MSFSVEDAEKQLQELVEKCKEVAHQVSGGKEVFAECNYCHSAVPLWEAILTQQIAGVLAHLSCPQDVLKAATQDAAPLPVFDFDEFSKAVEERMNRELPASCSGIINEAK